MRELGCLCRLSLHFPVISLVNLSREKKGEIDYMSLHAYMKTLRQGDGEHKNLYRDSIKNRACPPAQAKLSNFK